MHRPAPHLRGQRDADPRGRPGARRRGRHRRLRIEWRRGQAALLDGISGTVFTAGDNAYPTGAAADFGGCYEPSWGRHKARTRPTPGNHDYDTSGAAPYYAYFGASAGPAGRGYYSYDLGSWHVVSLNSEVDATSTSAQLQWLRDDLAAHPAACTLAYWHTPLFSSGEHGNLPVMQEVWKLLHEKGADVVINGHDHDYERFAPQNPYGQADPSGIREFVVGTGGTSERAFSALRANSEVRNRDTWGVLKLTLHATSYDWQFVPVAGKTFTDSGSGACFDGANPTATPTATPTPLPPGQTQLTFTPAADATVSQANPTTSYATNSQLESVDGSTTAKQAFLCFKVSGIPSGATIGSARLQLYVVNTSTSGGLVNSLTSTTWPESITWSTRPTVDGPRLASLGSVTAGDVVTVDVTSAVTGNGAYSFAISPLAGNTNTVGYSSRDASLIANRPQLIVLALTSPPTATPTPTVVPDNPEPAITGLSPSAVAAGGAAFTLTVTGTNFVDTSTVQWNGASRPTTFVSSTRLTAAIPASDIAVAGTASVTITNPAPGGGTAGPQTFTIAPSPGQNLLLNDGFELDTNGDGRPDSWTSSSRLTRSATPRHGGSYAGKHAATDNSGYTIYQQIDNLIAGQPYSFAGYVNIPATSDTFTFKLEIRWRSASGSTLRTDSVKSYGGSTGAANAGWDLAAASLTAPASTSNAQVRMVVSSLNATVFVDDFAFQPGAPPSDATPPAVIGRTPAAGASGVVPGATVSTQFSEAVTGVSGTSFTLTPQGGSTPLAATVGYDAATSRLGRQRARASQLELHHGRRRREHVHLRPRRRHLRQPGRRDHRLQRVEQCLERRRQHHRQADVPALHGERPAGRRGGQFREAAPVRHE